MPPAREFRRAVPGLRASTVPSGKGDPGLRLLPGRRKGRAGSRHRCGLLPSDRGELRHVDRVLSSAVRQTRRLEPYGRRRQDESSGRAGQKHKAESEETIGGRFSSEPNCNAAGGCGGRGACADGWFCVSKLRTGRLQHELNWPIRRCIRGKRLSWPNCASSFYGTSTSRSTKTW